MQGGQFQRYVWVQGERKRQRNRDKYETTRSKYLENEEEEMDSPKKPKVVWPGEFEKQLAKRDRNLAKIEKAKNGSSTPAEHTPSDLLSLTSENLSVEQLSDDDDEEKKKKMKEPLKNSKKTESLPRREPEFFNDGAHYLDEFLDSPKSLSPSKKGGSFFLVSSNLVE